MNESTAVLFDEFATAYRDGDAPDVLAYLERAGDNADSLADLIDRSLQAVPARMSTEEEIVLMHARLEQTPPLFVLRLRRALTRDAVVDALVRVLALDSDKRDKVAGYYHRLEVGTLDPEPVDRRVWDVLADVFRANARRLASFEPPPLAGAADTYLRLPDAQVKLRAYAASAPADIAGESDEIDRLFTGNA